MAERECGNREARVGTIPDLKEGTLAQEEGALEEHLPDFGVYLLIEELGKTQRVQSEMLLSLVGKAQSMSERISRTFDGVKLLTNEHRSLQATCEQMNRLGETHWEEHIIQPLVSQIFPIVDLVVSMRTGAGKDKHTASGMRALQGMLLEFLSTYGISVVAPRAKSKFDPTYMKALKLIRTEDKDLHNCVQGWLQIGLKLQKRVLRPASVAVWRYREDS